jgi:hypothetical protein
MRTDTVAAREAQFHPAANRNLTIRAHPGPNRYPARPVGRSLPKRIDKGPQTGVGISILY